ncbi:hypothetical protein [Pandoraea anhela]|uniref:Uncharacterized protein n=1 Tax=Pandoraea anhela TaxID=2508295 RepID=A0A5E4S5H8_9BURK|nr:hypothetical protein [Pandoraea anhela]VVD70897.1 hypothetical protein PAN31108_00621 [Pandoraea anhela]
MKGQANAAGLIQFFSANFDFKAATTEDLEFLSTAGEYVECNAISLAETVSGVASLIACDSDSRKSPSAGTLQGGDIANLLYLIADTVQTIGKLSYVAGEADYQLRDRMKGAPK